MDRQKGWLVAVSCNARSTIRNNKELLSVMIVRMRNSIGLLNKLLLLIVILSLTGCATMPENVDRTVSTTFQNGQDTALGRKFQEVHPEDDGKSGFLLLDNGLDAFVARAVLAQNAERSIDTQYYLLHDDV